MLDICLYIYKYINFLTYAQQLKMDLKGALSFLILIDRKSPKKSEKSSSISRRAFDFCLTSSITTRVDKRHIRSCLASGRSDFGRGACDTRGQGRTSEPGKHKKSTLDVGGKKKYDKRRNHLIFVG